MSQDYETPTSAGAYEPDPAVVIDDEGTQAYGTAGSYTSAGAYESAPSGSGGSTTEVAKEQAAAVSGTAADAGKHVAGVASSEASNVAGEAVDQGRNLLNQTKSELQDQVATQHQRVASGIRSLSDELRSISQGEGPQSGLATELAGQVSQRAADVASWLEQRNPGDLLQEVRDYARRRPGAFLAIAAGAGLIAGRLTRGTVAASQNSGSASSNGAGSAPSYPAYGAAQTSTAQVPVPATDPVTQAWQTEGQR